MVGASRSTRGIKNRRNLKDHVTYDLATAVSRIVHAATPRQSDRLSRGMWAAGKKLNEIMRFAL